MGLADFIIITVVEKISATSNVLGNVRWDGFDLEKAHKKSPTQNNQAQIRHVELKFD